MPGLRERIILRGIRMHYTGSPTIVVTLDGENVSTISDLPTHTTYKTRVVGPKTRRWRWTGFNKE